MGLPVFKEANIVLNAGFADKWEAIKACGQVLVDNGYVSEAYVDDMLERERSASVYVGNHVAIPHGVANSEVNIHHSGISFVQIPDGVDFGNEKAYVMVGIAGKDGTHIEMLGSIAMICLDMDNIDTLRNADTAKEVYEIFSELVS